MKSLKKPKSHRKTILIFAILLLLVGAGTAYAAVQKIGPFSTTTDTAENTSPKDNDINHNPPTDEQIQAGDEQSSDDKEPTKPTDNPTPPDTEPADGKRQAQVMIDSVNQAGGSLRVRTSINTIDADSTCKATLSRSAVTAFQETVATQTMPSYSMCKGFNIPLSGVAKGAWTLTILFESKSFKGQITQEVTLQ